MVIRWALKPIVARSRGVVKMHTQIMTVSPALAQEWLKKNTFNRRVSPLTVSKYASDMASGKWTINHQGIAFDDKGVLVDGQHRLYAVVKAGVSVDMMVTWGASRIGVDELRARSAQDVIAFGGLSDWLSRTSIQIAKAMIEISSGSRASAASTSSVVEFAERNKEAIQFIDSTYTDKSKGIGMAISRGTFAIAYYHVDKDNLARMIRVLSSGIPKGEHETAAVRLREFLTSGIGGGHTERLRQSRRIMRAIQLFEEGATTRLREPQEFIYALPEDKKPTQ